jgi:hypothetical protein
VAPQIVSILFGGGRNPKNQKNIGKTKNTKNNKKSKQHALNKQNPNSLEGGV